MHSVSQHTPSTQCPLPHSASAWQRWKPATVGVAASFGAPTSAIGRVSSALAVSASAVSAVSGSAVSAVSGSAVSAVSGIAVSAVSGIAVSGPASATGATHLPVASHTPLVQSASTTHALLHVVVDAHARLPAHGAVVAAGHDAVAPSHADAVSTPLAHALLPHAAPLDLKPHAPALHTPVAHGPVAQRACGSANPSTAVHVPIVAVRLHA